MGITRNRRPKAHTPDASGGRPEDGAILILALVFILIVSLSIFSLITFGGVGTKNAVNLRGQRSLEYAAEGVTEAAIQAVRYSNDAFTYPPVDCLPNGAALSEPGDSVTMTINGEQMVVDCAASALPANSPSRPQDRVVAFYACPVATLTGTPPACFPSNAIVAATVDFQDVSSAGVYQCSSSTGNATCGTGVAIVSWVLQTADN